MARGDEHSDDEERPKLQSLAQVARTNQLKQVRGTLVAIGILVIIFHGIDLVRVPGAVRTAMVNQGVPPANAPGLANHETFLITLLYAVDGGAILVGLLFLLFAGLVYSYPVPITISSLVLYVLMTLVCVPILIANVGAGPIVALVFRIVFIIALAKSVKTAFAYQREQQAQLAAAGGDWDDEAEDD